MTQSKPLLRIIIIYVRNDNKGAVISNIRLKSIKLQHLTKP